MRVNRHWRAKTLVESFWRKVDLSQPDSCWLWMGAKGLSGHGQVRHGEKHIRATAIAWNLHYGEWPADGFHLCHHCDNPPCVNPTHLFLGTARDNIRDCITKGRFKFLRPSLGVTNCNAKLTPERVIELRHRYARGETLSSLSRSFKMARSSLRWAVNGRSWKAVSV